MEFLEIKQQHDALRRTLARLKAVLSDPAGTGSTDLTFEAHSLYVDLKNHFRAEEEGGYLDVVLEERPGWSRRVDRLREQHREILEGLGHLAHQPEAEVARDLGRIIALVETHDSDESSLVQEAVIEDIGSAD